MSPKIKNIIIIVVILVALVLAYIFFVKGNAPEEGAGLVSTTTTSGEVTTTTTPTAQTTGSSVPVSSDFLAVLLNVKNIQLDDSIFSDEAFAGLRDSSILLTPDGNEGRPNPFAPIGVDIDSTSPTVEITIPTTITPTIPTETPVETPTETPVVAPIQTETPGEVSTTGTN